MHTHYVYANSPAREPMLCTAFSVGIVPLSYRSISYVGSLLFCCICCCYDATVERFNELSSHYRDRVFQRMEKIAEETIQKRASKIDGCDLKRTFEALAEDHELDQFFQCILGFRSSKVVKCPHRILHELGEVEPLCLVDANSCKKRREAGTTASPSIHSSASVVFTSIYIKAPMPPRQPSPLPPLMRSSFCAKHLRILHATIQTVVPISTGSSAQQEIPSPLSRPLHVLILPLSNATSFASLTSRRRPTPTICLRIKRLLHYKRRLE
ncbi:hypothetical protein BJV78DRAFT_1332601 [Lactifluus subvellereus]|nr:hypothetical protein BJV78DRAFT_1332601 [Lactifluus subvellereus]